MFENINYPEPKEIKIWLTKVKLTIYEASLELGISERQLLRFLSGETQAKKFHALAMQMIWLFEENKKDEGSKSTKKSVKKMPTCCNLNYI